MLHDLWVLLGSPSWVSSFALLGFIFKLIGDIYNRRALKNTHESIEEFNNKMVDELVVLHLKIQKVELLCRKECNDNNVV